MIVDDFNICGTFFGPTKANAKLIVYANAELFLPVTLQSFEIIAGRRPQKLQRVGRVKLCELPSCDPYNARKPLTLPRFKQCLRVATAKAIYHWIRL
jgi:hypothetical protein